MKTYQVKVTKSEEGRDAIFTEVTDFGQQIGYANAYAASLNGGFMTLDGWTILSAEVEERPTLLEQLHNIEQSLASNMIDQLDHAEREHFADGGRPDDHAEQDDGVMLPVLYPENGAPEWDHARTLCQELIEQLEKALKEEPHGDC